MQKHFRAGIGGLDRIAKGRRLYAEALNPYFGYFYTVKKTLAKRKTRHQEIRLIDTDEFGRVLLLDDVTQVAEKNDCDYHEPMVHPAFCSHPRPESVLVIGGGDGGILREVLKYPCVKNVEVAELDDGVIEFSRRHLAAIHGRSFDDPRVRIAVSDGRRYVEEHPGRFDIVIMDMTDPSGPSVLLYTREFFNLVKRSFRDKNGLFVMHTESPVSRPKAFSCIQKTLRASFSHVNPFYLYIQMYAVLWSITLCGETAGGMRRGAAAIDTKLARYGIRDLKVYSGATHVSMRTPFPYIEKLLGAPGRIITDAKPEFPDDFLS